MKRIEPLMNIGASRDVTFFHAESGIRLTSNGGHTGAVRIYLATDLSREDARRLRDWLSEYLKEEDST